MVLAYLNRFPPAGLVLTLFQIQPNLFFALSAFQLHFLTERFEAPGKRSNPNPRTGRDARSRRTARFECCASRATHAPGPRPVGMEKASKLPNRSGSAHFLKVARSRTTFVAPPPHRRWRALLVEAQSRIQISFGRKTPCRHEFRLKRAAVHGLFRERPRHSHARMLFRQLPMLRTLLRDPRPEVQIQWQFSGERFTSRPARVARA